MTFLIDSATTIGIVSLSVTNLQQSILYYRDTLGLTLHVQDYNAATFGVISQPLIRLYEMATTRVIHRTTGLYHFALRVPHRRDLAHIIRHFTKHGILIDGAADHLFSEALYVSDPDGHGIEMYCDRPPETWYNAEGQLVAVSNPLDLMSILGTLNEDEEDWPGMPPQTTMGHIHVQVADLVQAERFYINGLGFERMIAIPTASFISAGKYHHHIGMNIWAGIGIPPPPDNAARLLSYEIVLPHQTALSTICNQIHAVGIPLRASEQGWEVNDPSANCIILRHNDVYKE